MNYKYFRMMSEDDGMNGGGAEPNGEPNEGGQEPKSFDDLLKESDYQSEFDRRVTKAINTAVSKERARLEAPLYMTVLRLLKVPLTIWRKPLMRQWPRP